MDCQGLCSPKRAFSKLMAALKARKDKVKGFLPQGVKDFQLEVTDHMVLKAVITIKWAEVDGYLDGDLTGEQLASHAVIQ
jgi:hypothetical protein